MSFLKKQFTEQLQNAGKQKVTIKRIPNVETVSFEIHVEEEADMKLHIKEKPTEIENVIAYIKREPELDIVDVVNNPEEVEEEFVELIETVEDEDSDPEMILSEEGAPPIKKIILSRDIEPKSDEEFLKGLLPFFKQMTAEQKHRIQISIENMITNELYK